MKIGLGTVQFGLHYGLSNLAGKTPPEEVRLILEAASRAGVKVIDTASMYGDSEDVLGQSWHAMQDFRVVTKTPRLLDYGSADLLEETLFRSLERLKLDSVYGLLIHNTDDLFTLQGCSIVQKLFRLREQGIVKRIGVSVYTGAQIDAVLKIFTPDLIQLPFNVMDQRLLDSGHLLLLKKLGVEIHARSVFLQGLLLMDPAQLPVNFNSCREFLQEYHCYIVELGLTPLQAALGFVSNTDYIDAVICGVESLLQFEEVIAANASFFTEDFGRFAVNDEAIINPACWKTG